jgi:hypothetical protein
LLPLLQCKPNRSQNAIELSANLMIPESEHDDSLTSEKLRPYPIANLTRTVVYAHLHLTRSQALQPGNRNPVRNNQMDAGDKTCSSRNFGSANGAKESAQRRWPSFAKSRRGSQQYSNHHPVFEKRGRHPLTSILSPQAGRGRNCALTWT